MGCPSVILSSRDFLSLCVMSTEVKKEIQLEIAHVLFIDIVAYSKLSINDQRAAVDELTKVVRCSDQSEGRSCGSVDKNSNRRRHGAGFLH
jgi:hypothetical protein